MHVEVLRNEGVKVRCMKSRKTFITVPSHKRIDEAILGALNLRSCI